MDGADAVMLSGETSVGQYPVQVIKKMSSILKAVEHSELIQVPLDPPVNLSRRYITKSVCYHAAIMANEMKTAAISTLTNSGYTAYQISAWRPSSHILVFTANKRILTQLSLLWGVKAFYYDSMVSTDQTIEDLNNMAKAAGYVTEGDHIINLASMPIKERGMVNTLRVSTI
jgi:pyruvate kinase